MEPFQTRLPSIHIVEMNPSRANLNSRRSHGTFTSIYNMYQNERCCEPQIQAHPRPDHIIEGDEGAVHRSASPWQKFENSAAQNMNQAGHLLRRTAIKILITQSFAEFRGCHRFDGFARALNGSTATLKSSHARMSKRCESVWRRESCT